MAKHIPLFFAIESLKINDDAVIWAINVEWLSKKYMTVASKEFKKLKEDARLEKSNEIFKVILNDKKDFIKTANPFSLNERLVLQQGVFVLPLNIGKPFMENLKKCITKENEKKHILKIKIIGTKDFLKDALYNLNRMNINHATLFPGLEGFSRYLKLLVLIAEYHPEILDCDKEEF